MKGMKGMKGMNNIFLILMIFVANMVYASKRPKLHSSTPKVFVEKLKYQKIEKNIFYIGKITPVIESNIYSPIEGIVEKILVRPGQEIKKGQILAILKQNLIGQQVLPVKLASPLTGILYRPYINDHSLVKKNAHLFTIYGNKKYKVNIYLSPQDAKDITVGLKVSLSIDGLKYSGHIYSVAAELNNETGTRLTQVYLDKNIQDLIPGELAKVHFSLNQRQGLLVAKKYIHRKKNKKFIRVLDKNNEIKEITVDLLERIKNDFEIKSSQLKEEMEIVIKSSASPLIEGMKVEVVREKKE